MESTFTPHVTSSETNSEARKSTNKRSRRTPQRFGDNVQLDVRESDEDFLNLGDNSFDDITYEPPAESPEIVTATVQKRHKKAKTISDSIEKSSGPNVDLNDEFDLLWKSASIIAEKPMNNGHSTAQHTIEDVAGSETKCNDLSQVFGMCRQILCQMNEISARISVIEDTVIKGSPVLKDRKSNIVQKAENSRIFGLTNRMPIQNLRDLNAFEDNLNTEEFRNTAVIDICGVEKKYVYIVVVIVKFKICYVYIIHLI